MSTKSQLQKARVGPANEARKIGQTEVDLSNPTLPLFCTNLVPHQ